ncbi:MAG: hypothetical protein AAGA30_13900, partial [Planctomycetota bacterium]
MGFEPNEIFPFEISSNLFPGQPVRGNCIVDLIHWDTGELVSRDQIQLSGSKESDFEISRFVPGMVRMPSNEGVYKIRLSLPDAMATGAEHRNQKTRPTVREIQLVVLDPGKSRTERQSFMKLVDEIDPTSFSENRVGQFHQISKWMGGRSRNSSAQVAVENGKVVLPAGGWQLIPLNKFSMDPHLIEIEYVQERSTTMGFSILNESSARANVNLGLDSGFSWPSSSLSFEEGAKPQTNTHQFVYWPSGQQDYLLVANRSQKNPCRFNRIRIYESERKSTSTLDRKADGASRGAFAFYEFPFFAENFGVIDPLDPELQQPINGWPKFYQGVLRLVQQLKNTGMTGAFVNVYGEGSSLYPIASMTPSSRHDNGAFSSLGLDPQRKDVVEMIYRIFEREGLQFIPVLTFDHRFAELEHDYQLANQVTDKTGSPALSQSDQRPQYNPLSNQVQTKIFGVIRETVERYQDRPGYQGLAVMCRPDTCSLLPGSSLAGYDSSTLNRFRSKHPTETANQSQEDFSNWLSWRAKEMSRRYLDWAKLVSNSKPEAKLYLSLVDPFRNEEISSLLAPSLHRSADFNGAMHRLGLDRSLLMNSDGVVLMKPFKVAPTYSLASRKNEYSGRENDALVNWFQEDTMPCSLFLHRSSWARFDDMRQFSGLTNANGSIWRLQQLQPAGSLNRQRFATSIKRSDSRMLVDGGIVRSMQLDQPLIEFLDAYSKLPKVRFSDINHASSNFEIHPVAVRQCQENGSSYFYVVNDSPWPVSGDVRLKRKFDRQKLEVFGKPLEQPIENGDENGNEDEDVLRFSVRPFDLQVFRYADKISAENYTYQLPEESPKAMLAAYYQLRSKIIASGEARPIDVLVDGDFESETLEGNWSFGGSEPPQIKLSHDGARQGSQCLHIKHKGQGNCWVRSGKFGIP